MESVRIRNLRSLSDTGTIELRTINLLVGANSSGKSTFLKFFPLLQQSVEVPTSSGLLLVGGRVDLGTFNEAVRKGAGIEEISLEMATVVAASDMSPYYYKLYYGHPGFLEPLHSTICISFAKRESSLKTYVPRIKVTLDNDVLQLECDPNGKVAKVFVNDMDLSENCSALQLVSGRGVIPGLSYIKSPLQDDPAVGEQRPNNQNWLMSRLLHHTGHVFDKRTQLSTKMEILASIGVGRPTAMLKQMSKLTDNVGWQKMVKRTNVSDPFFIELRNLILADRMKYLLRNIDNSISSFARTIRSVAPVRATADRYVRNQELAVDEMDAEGRNLPMFLSSLPQSDQEAFCNWTQQNLGFSVKVEGDVHLSLKLKESEASASFNLTDTGFGFSQILPILVQTWQISRVSGNDEAAARIYRNRRGEDVPKEYTIAIEQPELHLHPGLQARLMDLLIRTVKIAKQGGLTVHILLETHSETIVNRVGFRVNCKDLEASDAQVLLFERKLDSAGFQMSTVRRTNYNEQGILDDWPFGFFLPDEESLPQSELPLTDAKRTPGFV